MSSDIMEQVKESPGQEISRRRRELALSQDELARMTGITKGQISNIERDLNKPNASTARLLAKHLDVSDDELRGFYERVVADKGGKRSGVVDARSTLKPVKQRQKR